MNLEVHCSKEEYELLTKALEAEKIEYRSKTETGYTFFSDENKRSSEWAWYTVKFRYTGKLL